MNKGAVMSAFLILPDELSIFSNRDWNPKPYEFDNIVAHNYFCIISGFYPFNQTFRVPEHFRVNLGYIEGINHESLEVAMLSGKNL
jgi:hypothetical protein